MNLGKIQAIAPLVYCFRGVGGYFLAKLGRRQTQGDMAKLTIINKAGSKCLKNSYTHNIDG